jgi:hypothetical protein
MCSVGNASFNRIWEKAAGNRVLRPQHYADYTFIRQHFIIRKYQYKQFMSIEHPIDHTWSKNGILTKLGGKDTSLFHSWQKRYFSITSDRKLEYSKGADSPVLGHIDLAQPMQQLPALEVRYLNLMLL